jgi:hypothetical protein
VSELKNNHLDDDQLLWAVVEEAELPASVGEHLSACSQCFARKERLEQKLARLGQKAEIFAPSPGKKVSLSVDEARSPHWWSWGWRTALAVSLAVIFIALWSSNIFIPSTDTVITRLNQEILEDERLMAEISLLEENALPSLFEDISQEGNSVFDEEFMEFVVPSVEDEIRSHNPTKRGAALC